MQKLWIYGAGGHARVVYDVVSSMNEYLVEGFIDDDTSRIGEEFIGKDISNEIRNISNVFIAIGDNAARKKISQNNEHLNYPVLIHPTAIIGKDVSIGVGTVVMPGSIIESNAKIGRHSIINNGSIIGHCSTIHDFCHIGGNSVVSGEVVVGESSLLGIGSCVIPQINIGEQCVICAGSVITKSVPDHSKMFGNPARNIAGIL